MWEQERAANCGYPSAVWSADGWRAKYGGRNGGECVTYRVRRKHLGKGCDYGLLLDKLRQAVRKAPQWRIVWLASVCARIRNYSDHLN